MNSWQKMFPYMSLEVSFEPLWSISENGMCYVMLILLSFKLPFVIPLQN